jgi:predicted transcriptional regulator
MELETLKEAGLTEGEAKVYLALLKLGQSTTGPIIEESKVANSIIYRILEKLIETGIVSYITKEKTKYFKAENPRKILEYLEEKKQNIEQSKDKIESLMPFLLKMTTEEDTSTFVYEGFKGFQTAFEHYYQKLKKDEEYYSWGVYPIQDEKYHLYWEKDHLRRKKSGIRCKILFNQGTDKEILKNRNSFWGCDARYMPSSIKTPAWFITYKNVTGIFLQSKKPIVVEIINKEIADSFKAYFDDLWNKSKPFKS